ncbi:hypothetical protein Cgig2_012148 [Carnegiea gigantea]|uniref:Squalene cyclase C-terminal domain-containing protein n=1 Tax=Carnegiea gigantea TaxID=171969 RepID=A0A9Q1KRR7_9CARY|nr:hypothetical protein Cgig2_012148 [Carnegiea gigantea]
MMQDMVWGFLHYFAEPLLNRWPLSKLRDKALKIAMEHVHYEDINSRYLSIGLVEKVLSMLACWVEDPNSEAHKRHLARVPDYLWVAEDGMKAQGVGTQTWDAAFAVQAISASGLIQEYAPTLTKAHDFLEASQLRDNPSDNFKEMYRHICKGAWPLEIADQGLQVCDCTAEALKASLLLSKMSPGLVGEKIEAERLYNAVDVILSLQAIKYGNWGICFTYGTFFAMDALVACGRSYRNSRPLRKACEFLLSKQLPDGGWGESYLSCTNKAYTNIDGNKSNVVNTAWALLALVKAGQVRTFFKCKFVQKCNKMGIEGLLMFHQMSPLSDS